MFTEVHKLKKQTKSVKIKQIISNKTEALYVITKIYPIPYKVANIFGLYMTQQTVDMKKLSPK